MATSTYFGWTEPDDTDLVKNGASAMRTLGNAIDSSLYAVAGQAAGKNKIINGDFSIWQRGTSISLSNSTRTYGADRFAARSFFSAGSSTFSQQTFTAGSAPVSGYEGTYFGRISCGSTATAWQFDQRLEDVRQFAGQTVTFSFWIKASSSNPTTVIEIVQNFGSGGSASVITNATGPNITTSWQRFNVTLNIPSISGKTIGTGSYIEFSVYSNSGVTNSMSVDTWGWQVEAGSTATPFQTATGTKQGELAACQRYYWRMAGAGNYAPAGISGAATSSTAMSGMFNNPVPMRTSATALEFSNLAMYDGTTVTAITNITFDDAGITSQRLSVNVASGLTQYRPYYVIRNNNSSGYLGFSAEL